MQQGFVEAAGHRLEYRLIPAHQLDRPTLVFLHEGLGSLAMWRDFPAKVAAATGCRTLVYSRYGYGESDVLAQPFAVRYMHDEALIALPELLDKLEIDKPVLVKGRVVFAGSSSELTDNEELMHRFLGV